MYTFIGMGSMEEAHQTQHVDQPAYNLSRCRACWMNWSHIGTAAVWSPPVAAVAVT